MSDFKPLTVVETGVTSIAEMEARVIETRQRHGDVLQRYHEIWYNAPHTWQYTHFLGVGMMKCPNDLWAYQDIITSLRPKTIIETGTYAGGSALFYAFLMDMLRIDGGHIYSIDIADYRQCDHPRVTFLGGSSVDPVLAASVIEQIQYPLLVTLDSDHSEAHVRAELDLYAPHCRVGDRLVVEDTNIGWGDPGDARGDRGARGGLETFLLAHEGEFRQDLLCERHLLTMNPGGWLERVAPCTHG